MAELVISSVVSTVANSLSKIVIEEYEMLGGGTVRHLEWIERELRLMKGLLDQLEQNAYDQQKQLELKGLEEDLKKVSCGAADVIQTFLEKSVKRRSGVPDQYEVGKKLQEIRRKMRHLSQSLATMKDLNTNVCVSIETPGEASSSSSSSSTTSSVINTAIEKLHHILHQDLISDGGTSTRRWNKYLLHQEKVNKMVEQVKDDILHMKNIMSNFTYVEIENVWLEEVNEVCKCTADIAGKFIDQRKDRVNHCASAWEFEKQMKHVSTRIGDAFDRCWTYEIGGVMNQTTTTTQRSTTVPVQDLSVENLILFQIPFLVYYVVILFVSYARVWPTPLFILIIFYPFNVIGKRERIRKLKSRFVENGKNWSGKRKFTVYALSCLMIFVLSKYLPLQATFLLNFISLFDEVIVWTVNLRRSVDKNLKCVQRYTDVMRVFLSVSEGGLMNLNKRQRVWMGQVRAVSRNSQSLIDAAAYPEGKGGGWLSRARYARDVNNLLKEILDISDRKLIHGIPNITSSTKATPQVSVPSSPMRINESEHDHNSGTAVYRPVTGLKEKVQSIIREKELMDAMLDDAEEMEELDGRSRVWVQQLKGISDEAKSVIDIYDAKLKHKSILIYIYKYWTRRVVGNKIDGIRDKIEHASRMRIAYGLVNIQSPIMSTVQILYARSQPSIVAKESDVIGFDDDTQVLMAKLLSDEKRCCITWIVGISGTGKTTLANLIYEDNDVVAHFQCRVLVSLSPPPLIYSAQAILEEIAKEAAKQITVEEGLSILETLARKKYLIVVDGIEEPSQVSLLDTLNRAIPDTSTGSRLLFTTRKANLAQHAAAGTTFVHPLQLLDDESSWLLFKRHWKVDNKIYHKSEIVMKCGGLPSQIITTSKYPSRELHSWSEMFHTIYTNLPLYHKKCLFYFLNFPVDFGIPVRRLVALWVADGLVHHSEEGQVPAELVAERYLTELIHQNMVQVATRKRNGKVKTCRLPYALRQLWMTGSNDVQSPQDRQSTTYSDADLKKYIVRRVADHVNTGDIWHNHIHVDTSPKSSSLRKYYRDVLSFLSFDTQEGSKPGQQVGNFIKACISSDCFLRLQVLDLERVYKPKLPKCIEKLTQLRYLGLRWTYLESLPSSISKLLKLQTLDLKHTYIHTLPTSIWTMELRHLFLSETYHTRFPPQPKDHFSRIRFLLPQPIDDYLSDLQTLWGLFVDEETPVKGGLDKLVNVTKLGLACQSMSLQPAAMMTQLEAVADWIAKLDHLQSLRLKSRDEKGRPWILHLKSFANHSNLTDIYLLGRLISSKVLSQFPLHLVELTLSHSKLFADPMKLLKDFPNLRTLCLLAESYVGTTMVCEYQSFPQLRVLKLWVLKQLKEWMIEPRALPCLRQLEIRSCPCLKRLPDGLKSVNTLLELKLTDMSEGIDADMYNILPNCQVIRGHF